MFLTAFHSSNNHFPPWFSSRKNHRLCSRCKKWETRAAQARTMPGVGVGWWIQISGDFLGPGLFFLRANSLDQKKWRLVNPKKPQFLGFTGGFFLDLHPQKNHGKTQKNHPSRLTIGLDPLPIAVSHAVCGCGFVDVAMVAILTGKLPWSWKHTYKGWEILLTSWRVSTASFIMYICIYN